LRARFFAQRRKDRKDTDIVIAESDTQHSIPRSALAFGSRLNLGLSK
jgi:hypothetical protein